MYSLPFKIYALSHQTRLYAWCDCGWDNYSHDLGDEQGSSPTTDGAASDPCARVVSSEESSVLVGSSDTTVPDPSIRASLEKVKLDRKGVPPELLQKFLRICC